MFKKKKILKKLLIYINQNIFITLQDKVQYLKVLNFQKVQ